MAVPGHLEVLVRGVRGVDWVAQHHDQLRTGVNMAEEQRIQHWSVYIINPKIHRTEILPVLSSMHGRGCTVSKDHRMFYFIGQGIESDGFKDFISCDVCNVQVSFKVVDVILHVPFRRPPRDFLPSHQRDIRVQYHSGIIQYWVQ